MGDVNGFLKYRRQLPPRRPVPVRLRDWKEVYEPFPVESARQQGARCMDCGIPFCHEGCPLGNLIPEWNDLVYRDDWSRGGRAPARHQQLPRVHRPAVPGPVRGGLRPGHQRRPGDHRADRVRDHRAGLGRGRVVAGAPRPHPPASGWPWSDRGRPGWPRPSSWPGPATGWWCSSGPRGPAGSSATGSPSSRWRRRCSTAGSTRWRPRASSSGAGSRWGSATPRCPGASAGDATVVSARSLVDEFDSVVLAGGATLPRDLRRPRARALRGSTWPWTT